MIGGPVQMVGILLLPIVLLVVLQVVMVLSRPKRPVEGRTENHRRVVRRLNVAGIVVLAAGLVASATVFVLAEPDPAADPALQADTLSMSHKTSKKVEMQMEQQGGKASVEMSNFIEWLLTFFHGRALAGTIGVLSLLLSVGLFLVAKGLH